MAVFAVGVGASHTTLMNTQWDKVAHLKPAVAYKEALGLGRDCLAGAGLDAVVIIGSNHFRGFWLDLMPAFTIGVDEVIAAGEHGTPKGPLKTNSAFAIALSNALIARDFDMAFSTQLNVDHGISHAVQYLLDGINLPIIPIVINCFAPPLPSLSRVEALGHALRDAASELAPDVRLGVIATGGLSHALPFPDWRAPETDDDAFIAASWREGRGRWSEFEERRRAIILGASSRINEAFDEDFLDHLSTGSLPQLVRSLEGKNLDEIAGNGGNEVRAWIAMSACMQNTPAEILSYAPMPEWLTGMAVATMQSEKDI